MFGPFSKPKGTAFNVPPQISRLPVSLLRTALVTREPELTARGVQVFRRDMAEDRDPPPMLPQRMMFQQWKTDLMQDGLNRGGFREPLSSAESFARVSGAIENLQPRVKQRAPVYEEVRAAAERGAYHFPESPTLEEPPYVLSRDLPDEGPRDAPPSDAYIATQRAVEARGAGQRAGACSRAMTSAAAARARAVSVIKRGA